MNFLAHFQLAWPDPGLLVGGLEGEYYKGPIKGDLPQTIESGIRLHRAIDAYTDAHPLIAQLKSRFPPRLRRFAGILIDLSFDHFLSRHWTRFSELPLEQFNRQVYATLADNRRHLSDASRRMLGRLVQHDILGLYVDWETVPASAERVGQRFRRENPFLDVGRELAGERERLEAGFLLFYPDLQAYSRERHFQWNDCTEPQSKLSLHRT
jgi:acyl carrier protein phosphodiesterase